MYLNQNCSEEINESMDKSQHNQGHQSQADAYSVIPNFALRKRHIDSAWVR